MRSNKRKRIYLLYLVNCIQVKIESRPKKNSLGNAWRKISKIGDVN